MPYQRKWNLIQTYPIVRVTSAQINVKSKGADLVARKLATKFGIRCTKGIDSERIPDPRFLHAPFCLPNLWPSACKVDKVSRPCLTFLFLRCLPQSLSCHERNTYINPYDASHNSSFSYIFKVQFVLGLFFSYS